MNAPDAMAGAVPAVTAERVLEPSLVANLHESTETAYFARNCLANEVAAWTLAHHPDLPIARQWKQAEEAYQSLQHAYVAVKAVTK